MRLDITSMGFQTQAGSSLAWTFQVAYQQAKRQRGPISQPSTLLKNLFNAYMIKTNTYVFRYVVLNLSVNLKERGRREIFRVNLVEIF